MLLSGAVIGSAATPEAIAAAARYPGSIVILLGSMLSTVLLTGWLLVRFGGWSRLDALLGSAPGALSAVMAVARERSEGSMPSIAIVQFFRLFVLMAAVPSLMVLVGVGQPTPLKAVAPAWADAGLMLAAGLGCGWLFRRIGMVAPMILGSTLASTLLHGFGIVQGSLPVPLAVMAFVILGAMFGARLGSLDRATTRRLLPLALAAFATSVGVACLFAWPAALIAGVPYGAAFVAFAPGGLEAMALLAVALGLDPLYVGAHHLVRFMAVGFLLPVLVRLMSPDPH
jgi:membrane AbrB-like protein